MPWQQYRNSWPQPGRNNFQDMRFIIKTLHGLEGVLAEELQELGMKSVQPGLRSVEFTGGLEELYKANVGLRTALRILCELKEFRASHPDTLYREIYDMEWENWFTCKKSIAVDSVVNFPV